MKTLEPRPPLYRLLSFLGIIPSKFDLQQRRERDALMLLEARAYIHVLEEAKRAEGKARTAKIAPLGAYRDSVPCLPLVSPSDPSRAYNGMPWEDFFYAAVGVWLGGGVWGLGFTAALLLTLAFFVSGSLLLALLEFLMPEPPRKTWWKLWRRPGE